MCDERWTLHVVTKQVFYIYLVKFPEAVFKLLCSQSFSILSNTHRQSEYGMPPVADHQQRHNN